MLKSGNGRHRKPRQAPTAMVAVAATGAGLTLPAASGASAADANSTWNAVAMCESGGLWSSNTGNGFFGGLQITEETWEQYGGAQYAERPDLASRNEQISVAEKMLAELGPDAWSGCADSSGLTDALDDLLHGGQDQDGQGTGDSTGSGDQDTDGDGTTTGDDSTGTTSPGTDEDTTATPDADATEGPDASATPSADDKGKGKGTGKHRKPETGTGTGTGTATDGTATGNTAGSTGTQSGDPAGLPAHFVEGGRLGRPPAHHRHARGDQEGRHRPGQRHQRQDHHRQPLPGAGGRLALRDRDGAARRRRLARPVRREPRRHRRRPERDQPRLVPGPRPLSPPRAAGPGVHPRPADTG